MSDEIHDIKEKLRQMRSENRITATENRRLYSQIRHLDKAISELRTKRQSDSTDCATRIQQATNEIDNEAVQRAQQRKERRREILTEIRKQTQINKTLTADIQAIQAEIERINQIHEVIPSRLAQSPAPRRTSQSH